MLIQALHLVAPSLPGYDASGTRGSGNVIPLWVVAAAQGPPPYRRRIRIPWPSFYNAQRVVDQVLHQCDTMLP